MSATAPEHEVWRSVVEAFTAVDVVYAVVHDGTVVSTVSLCPLTQPRYDGVIVGMASPYVTLGLDAVTVTPLRPTVTAPAVYEKE